MVRFVVEGVVEGQAAELLDRRLDQLLFGETERGRPQAGQCLDVLLARVVVDVNALALFDDVRTLLGVLRQVGVGVQDIRDVAAGGRIADIGHRSLLLLSDAGAKKVGRARVRGVVVAINRILRRRVKTKRIGG
jgi:hypothetical protein